MLPSISTTSDWCDTHIHLTALRSLAAARAVGVGIFVVPAIAPDSWNEQLETVATIPAAWAALGVHPQAAPQWDQDCAARLHELLAHERVVALGEIGLDATLDIPALVQEEALRAQLRIAVARNLPVLVHCRRAYGRLLQIFDEEGAAQVGGILHAFSGSLETARAAVSRNFTISFAGPLTWSGVRRAPQVLAALPATAIVIETDAPDLAPEPHRGEENRPEYLPLIGAEVARVRGWSVAETARITTANACRVLRLPPS